MEVWRSSGATLQRNLIATERVDTGVTAFSFAITWDYRCPYARNANEHVITALEAGADWDVLTVNDLGEACYATPALSAGRIYLRTGEALYCFGTTDRDPQSPRRP